jgi:hypothetical protein
MPKSVDSFKLFTEAFLSAHPTLREFLQQVSSYPMTFETSKHKPLTMGDLLSYIPQDILGLGGMAAPGAGLMARLAQGQRLFRMGHVPSSHKGLKTDWEFGPETTFFADRWKDAHEQGAFVRGMEKHIGDTYDYKAARDLKILDMNNEVKFKELDNGDWQFTTPDGSTFDSQESVAKWARENNYDGVWDSGNVAMFDERLSGIAPDMGGWTQDDLNYFTDKNYERFLRSEEYKDMVKTYNAE